MKTFGRKSKVESRKPDGFGASRAFGLRPSTLPPPLKAPARPRRNAVKAGDPRLSAFTLIELILIMAVIVVSAALIVPRLANFFRGRTLDSEARQILALMHHGQSRAVSAGVPMVLWLDPKAQTYGLEEEPGYTDKDPDAVDFTLDKDLQFEIPAGDPMANAVAVTQTTGPHAGQPQIRFLPDGTIADTSPKTIRVVSGDGSSLALTQSRDRSQYEVQTTNQWSQAGR